MKIPASGSLGGDDAKRSRPCLSGKRQVDQLTLELGTDRITAQTFADAGAATSSAVVPSGTSLDRTVG